MFAFFRRLSKDRFARKMMRAIAAVGGPTDWSYEPDTFMLKRPETVAFLGNVYHAYGQAKGAERQRIFDNYVGSFAQSQGQNLSSFTDVEDKLVAVARERSFLAALEGPGWGLDKASDPSVWPAHEPLSQWFSRAVVIDFPTHVMVVNHSHLKSWGITFEEAFSRGLEKLRESTFPKFRQEDGYFVSAWNDDFDSSRILLPTLFDDLPLTGEPIVVLPNRLTLMVAGSEDHGAIRKMLRRAEEIVAKDPKPQNPAPLVIRDGNAVDFTVAPTSPIWGDVERARKFAGLATYQDQKANLELSFKKAGKDIFVASFTLYQMESGAYATQSVWSKDVATLLPETDFVAFFDGDRPEEEQMVAHVSWRRVLDVCGDLMLDTKMFPPRFFVSKFPTEEQLETLKIRI